MSDTAKAPKTAGSKVSLKDYKRTKIIATLGPATDTYEQIKALIENGANGIRFNMSHGTHDERVRQTKWIRKAAKEAGKPVAIILDLQGPKVRLGDFEGMVSLTKGQEIRLQYQKGDWDYEATGILPTQYDLSKKVKRGERLYMFDGRIRTTVTSVKDGIVHARVENDGIVVKRKGINLPDTDFGGDVITEKDKKPVSGIGDKAYLFYITSKNPVDHGTTLVMTVGEYTVTAELYEVT